MYSAEGIEEMLRLEIHVDVIRNAEKTECKMVENDKSDLLGTCIDSDSQKAWSFKYRLMQM